MIIDFPGYLSLQFTLSDPFRSFWAKPFSWLVKYATVVPSDVESPGSGVSQVAGIGVSALGGTCLIYGRMVIDGHSIYLKNHHTSKQRNWINSMCFLCWTLRKCSNHEAHWVSGMQCNPWIFTFVWYRVYIIYIYIHNGGWMLVNWWQWWRYPIHSKLRNPWAENPINQLIRMFMPTVLTLPAFALLTHLTCRYSVHDMLHAKQNHPARERGVCGDQRLNYKSNTSNTSNTFMRLNVILLGAITPKLLNEFQLLTGLPKTRMLKRPSLWKNTGGAWNLTALGGYMYRR